MAKPARINGIETTGMKKYAAIASRTKVIVK